MLSSIRCENFKLFKNFEVNDFKRINIFVGETNSGKTALLEAIFSILTNLSQDNFLALLRGYPVSVPLNKEVWNLIVTGDQTVITGVWKEHEIKLRICPYVDPTKELLTLLPPSADVESGIKIERIYNSSKETLVLCFDTRFLDNFRQNFPKIPPIPPLISVYKSEGKGRFHVPLFFHRSDGKMSLEVVRRLIGEIIKKDLKDDLLELVRKFEPDVEDINNIPFADFETPALKIRGKGYLPLNSMGDGFYRAFCFGCLILVYKDGVVLIDEIENGIYHAFQGSVWKWLEKSSRRFNVQLFITTHSNEFIENALSSLEKETLSEIALFRLSKEKSPPTVIPGNELIELVEYGYEYR